jgi:hypothetical protein
MGADGERGIKIGASAEKLAGQAATDRDEIYGDSTKVDLNLQTQEAREIAAKSARDSNNIEESLRQIAALKRTKERGTHQSGDPVPARPAITQGGRD